MSGPRTARDALLAELLGDVDKTLDRVETCTAELVKVRDSISELGDKQSAFLAQEIEAAKNELNASMIARIDDFVAVANETLVRFNDKTKDIQTELARVNASSATVQPQAQPVQAVRRVDALSFVLGAIVLALGCVCGLLIR